VTDDDELRARLRRADPAASLEPASPARVTHLVEEAMSRNTRRWALPVAAALVLIAGGTAWAVTSTSAPERDTPVAAPSATAPGTTPSAAATAVVRITDSGAQAKCAAPEAQRLAEGADLAVEGTVTKIEKGQVTLTVSKVFRGVQAAAVEVAQTDDATEQLLGAQRFQAGGTYLIASAEGRVMICGYTGEADTPGLRELYEAAF
jgi:pyruvate/2-oxoglutarate dehydrogenase complex dihydrolipoamide acyltransferase (E2) component